MQCLAHSGEPKLPDFIWTHERVYVSCALLLFPPQGGCVFVKAVNAKLLFSSGNSQFIKLLS